MRDDMLTAFWEAIQRPGGAVGRGPRRWYVEIHPQAFGGFADLCAHPWVVCRGVLGPEYKLVEIGFDTPFEGAMNLALASRLPHAARDLARPPHRLAGPSTSPASAGTHGRHLLPHGADGPPRHCAWLADLPAPSWSSASTRPAPATTSCTTSW
jgi:hypothetical protein